MKYLFIFILIVFRIIHSHAQGGELQFSQTRLLTKTISQPSKKWRNIFINPSVVADTQFFFMDSLAVVVPANKTLKIESIYLGGNGIETNFSGGSGVVAYTTPASSPPTIYNGISVYLKGSTISGFPLWLPSGTHQFVIFAAALPYFHANTLQSLPSQERTYLNATRIYCTISAIEFNIIP